MKRFGTGLIWGSIIGIAGLVIVSEVSPMPDELSGLEAANSTSEPAPTTDAEEPAPPVAPAVEAEPVASEADASAPAEAENQQDQPAPAEAATEPEAPAGGASASLDVEPAPSVEVPAVPAGVEAAQPTPDAGPQAPASGVAVESASAPPVQAPTSDPAPPQTDTDAATVPALDLAIPASPVPEAPAEDAVVAAMNNPAVEPAAPVTAPAAPTADTKPAAADLPPAPPPEVPEAEAQVEPTPEIVPEGEAAMLPSDSPLSPVAPLPGTNSTEIERPVAGFDGHVDGVKVGRLPRIGDDATENAQVAADADPANQPPIERYARPFDNPEGKPAFAIVLVDTGDPGVDRAKLAALPFPVTFALDPTLPNVEELAAPYLAAGQEVVMLATAIPSGATAADLEVTFSAHAAALPEAVAVLDLAEGGFQNDRPLATQIVPIVKGQGRGLLTYKHGLNPADQVASREGLRAATVFRALDAENESATAIRRYLDRAAFKAAQDGRVVVVGKTQPETIAALMEWSLQGRAGGVALAPLTGVLVAR